MPHTVAWIDGNSLRSITTPNSYIAMVSKCHVLSDQGLNYDARV